MTFRLAQTPLHRGWSLLAAWIGLIAMGSLATAADQRLELVLGWNLIS
jgi:hypothetical protein